MAGERIQHDQRLDLHGVRVLLVEDEFYIADDLQRLLESAGAIIIGPFSTVERATAAIDDGGIDCAVIDLDLHGESAVPIAERLADNGTPFVIATGYGSPAVPEQLQAAPRIEKPFDAAAMTKLIGKLGRAPVSMRY